MSYIGNEPIVSATRTVTEITATAGQTTFTANGGYTVGYIDVLVNGAQLQTADFTATDGSTVVLTQAAQVGDNVRLVAWGTFQASSALTANNPSYTGTLTGGTGVVNIGSGQIYKDASGNVGIGTASPGRPLDVNGSIRFASGGVIEAGGSGGLNTYIAGIEGGSGYWAFATNAGERMRIDSSGNVGIGTNSPTGRLTVSGGSLDVGGSASPLLRIIENTGIGNPKLQLLDINNQNSPTEGAELWYESSTGHSYLSSLFSGGDLVFRTGGTNTRMRIDSAGRVTTPNQPFFMGQPTTNYSGGGMPTGVVAFTAIYNNGGHFNSANSRFTAPVGGWYRTTWGGLQLGGAVTSLMVNGVRTHNGNHYVNGASYITMTQTAIRYLNPGDYLNIEGWNGGGYYNDWYLWTVELIG